MANLHHQLSRWNQVIFWRSIKVLHHLTFTFKTFSCWFTKISFDDTKKLSVKILSNSSLLNKVSIFPKRKLTFTYFEIECFRGFSVGYQRQSTYVSWRNLLSKNKKKISFPYFVSVVAEQEPSCNSSPGHCRRLRPLHQLRQITQPYWAKKRPKPNLALKLTKVLVMSILEAFCRRRIKLVEE